MIFHSYVSLPKDRTANDGMIWDKMWVKQFHKPSPSHHQFYKGGLWHCLPILNPNEFNLANIHLE